MRANTIVTTITAVALAMGAAATARPARACGGCFHQPSPTQVTVVTGHRMVFSVSQQQTVLWDQIEYSGSPEDFAWILPVQAGATLQLSHDEFFSALDSLTDPVITGPSPNCNGAGGGGVGCGSAASDNSALAPGASGSGSSVQVVSQSVVGPYDTVTIQSTDPNAIYDWLNANGYATPDAMRPTIDAYVQGGFDFLAVRLAPGQGVQAMQPVRVVTQGAGLVLPLRMVAAGVGAQVGITLYVISEGRYEAQNFPNAVVQQSQLTWDPTQNQSNYETLAEQLMGGNGGTWLTEFAAPTSLVGSPQSALSESSCTCSDAQGVGISCFGQPTLPGAYYGQCTCPGLVPACSDAGASGASCSDPCNAFDDLSVALVGMDPTGTWVTRLRTILPPAALTANDLVIQASAGQAEVSNQLTASVYDDPSYSPCSGTAGNGGGGCSSVSEEPDVLGQWLVGGSLVFVGGALARRRRARK
jgi:hypothetical protein